MKYLLPPVILPLVEARNRLKAHYGRANLNFTLDGNLVGDLGEAVAAELFGLELTGPGNEGVDGYAPDGRSVQVKASGTQRGAAFRLVETRAEHLIFFHFNYDECYFEIIYNGPEEPVRGLLPERWAGQKSVGAAAFRRLNAMVEEGDRLPIVSPAHLATVAP